MAGKRPRLSPNRHNTNVAAEAKAQCKGGPSTARSSVSCGIRNWEHNNYSFLVRENWDG